MSSAQPAKKDSLVAQIRQSPPLEFPGTVDESWLKGKTVIITGGASGFGRGFVQRWAKAGAIIVFGDYNHVKGAQVEKEVRAETSNGDVYFVGCDVTKWDQQVELFKAAIERSPHGGIDVVVANAGIADAKLSYENPKAEGDSGHPSKPDLAVVDVNLVGTLYTVHLAMYHLPRNPGSRPADPDCDPSKLQRDRHVLIMGSMASVAGITGQGLYSASKHGVLGLFRSVRSTGFTHGIRYSFLAPYYIDTPLLSAGARFLLAGGMMGVPEDVVEAGTRLASDPRIVGRAMAVGPRLKVEEKENGEWVAVGAKGNGKERSLWEIYPHDYDDAEAFNKNFVKMLRVGVGIRGTIGWVQDILRAIMLAITSLWRS